MGLITNLTDFVVGHFAGKDHDGRTQVVCVLKATYEWNDGGALSRVKSAVTLREADEYAGKPAVSGMIFACDLGPAKPRTDVLLAGAVVFPEPVEEVDVTLEIGSRLHKTVRVFGDRFWLPGVVADLVMSRPKAVARVPIAWERSFGGHDPKDPTCIERRNPVGTGLCRGTATLHGRAAPNFEDPSSPIRTWKDRPSPVGFGPIAPHWPPRAQLAGLFDERWERERRPLLPKEFSPAFFNVAPIDQQLDGFVPGEEVRLRSMTSRGRDRFKLPDLSVPVTFINEKLVMESATQVDTITIEPAERRVSLLARATFAPQPTVLALRQIVVGVPTPGLRRAMAAGKRYVDRRPKGQNGTG